MKRVPYPDVAVPPSDLCTPPSSVAQRNALHIDKDGTQCGRRCHRIVASSQQSPGSAVAEP